MYLAISSWLVASIYPEQEATGAKPGSRGVIQAFF
jgi:hypothetical protein